MTLWVSTSTQSLAKRLPPAQKNRIKEANWHVFHLNEKYAKDAGHRINKEQSVLSEDLSKTCT